MLLPPEVGKVQHCFSAGSHLLLFLPLGVRVLLQLEVTVDGSKSGVADASKSSWESHLRSQLLPKLQERLTDFEKQLVNR